MKMLYKQPNFSYTYEFTEDENIFTGTFLGKNPTQNPLFPLEDVFGQMIVQIETLFQVLGRPQMSILKDDFDVERILYRYKGENVGQAAEVRVIFDREKVYAQFVMNFESMWGRRYIDDLKQIISTAISMAVEL